MVALWENRFIGAMPVLASMIAVNAVDCLSRAQYTVGKLLDFALRGSGVPHVVVDCIGTGGPRNESKKVEEMGACAWSYGGVGQRSRNAVAEREHGEGESEQ